MNMLLWVPIWIFSLVSFLQLFYYIRYFRLLAFYNPKQLQSHLEHPVSIVICARDEADEIEVNLPGVLAQRYRTTHEIVVVNDNSQDDTKYLLEGLYRDFKQLHIVELKQEAKHIPGKKFPLSVGIKSAKYEVLLLTDADCIPSSENWIYKMQNGFQEGVEVVLGYGAYKKRKGLLNKIIRWDTFHTALQYLSFALGGNPYMGVGRNLAYKKELFFRHKGFASFHHLPGGDDDLFINACADKHNTAVVIDQDAFTLSTPARSWSEWFKQKERHNSTGRFYKSKHQLLLGLYMGSHFLYYPAFVAALLTFDWRSVLGLFVSRMILQGIVFYKSMSRLNERDLFLFYPLWDIFMFFYYLIFMSSAWKKPKSTWN